MDKRFDKKLKRLQRLFAKTKKGTKKWCILKRQINKEYEKISNRKEDIANKFVNKLKDYKNVIIQDENLRAWHSSNTVSYTHLTLPTNREV